MVNTKKPNRKSAILVIRPPKGRGDRSVANVAIVHPRQISVQTQIPIKKPYQMDVERLSSGFAGRCFFKDQPGAGG